MTTDLREVAEADVYVGDELVAHLVRKRGDRVSFDYIGEPPQADTRIRERSVSWSLLRSGQYPVVTTSGAVPAFFDLLPEGVRLGVVTSSMKTSADDHFTLLLAIGADTIGDVRVVPTGVDPARPQPMFDPSMNTDFQGVYARLTGSVDADPLVFPESKRRSARQHCPCRPGPDPGRRYSSSVRCSIRCSSRTSTSS